MNKVLVIAEAGVNHNGDIEIAREMIDVAASSGADAIKFQTFKATELVVETASKAEYQKKATDEEGTQLEMLRKLELDEKAHKEIIKLCKEKDIAFLFSAFDMQSIDLLVRLGVDTIKIPSGEITNVPYLRKIGSLGKTIIMSTGMATLEEVDCSLKILTESGAPLDDITILHCNTEYPTPAKDANLLAMCSMRDTFGVRVGYSDHTLGIEVSIAAVALGASVIEKHFTLDRKMEGPDHKASLGPAEFKELVATIRTVEMALGSRTKKPSPSEMKNMSVVRKSIVAARDIEEGEVFTEENVTTKRPATGISAADWDDIIGERASRAFQEDEMIAL